MAESQRGRRVIEINQHVIGPRRPKTNTVRARKLSDYPHLPAAHGDVVRCLSSPLRMGPPVCDELVALVRAPVHRGGGGRGAAFGAFFGPHRRRVGPRRTSAAGADRADSRPAQPGETHHRPQRQRGVRNMPRTGSSGKVLHLFPQYRYRLLPIVPGIFEMMLISHTPESLTDWHRRFIELFEALYETGYSLDYKDHPTPVVRYLPVGKTIDAHPMALPSDKLEVVFDQFELFGIGQCQCRMAMQAIGQGCGKPLGNCTVMGQWAERGIAEGVLRQVSKKEALAIKREAESHGMVNWMMNVRVGPRPMLLLVLRLLLSRPAGRQRVQRAGVHCRRPTSLPQLDASKCTYCGKCAQGCPMGAIVVDTQQKTQRHLGERCIGCGLCVLACDRQQALVMEPVPDYKLPYRSWYSLIAHSAPGMLMTNWKVWRQRA